MSLAASERLCLGPGTDRASDWREHVHLGRPWASCRGAVDYLEDLDLSSEQACVKDRRPISTSGGCSRHPGVVTRGFR